LHLVEFADTLPSTMEQGNPQSVGTAVASEQSLPSWLSCPDPKPPKLPAESRELLHAQYQQIFERVIEDIYRGRSLQSLIEDDYRLISYEDFLRSVYASYYAVMRTGAVIYVAHGESERAAFTDCMVEAGLKLSQVLIWVKQSATLSRQDFNWQHEPILYGWKEGSGHYFCGNFTLTTVIDDDVDLKSMKKEQLIEMINEIRNKASGTIIRHNRPTKSDLHPTMKPVALVERMIEWSSHPGDIVLDLFGGSGSTLIAAQKANRQARLMELDPKFVDVIIKRWQEFTGKQATHAETGKPFAEVKNGNEKAIAEAA